MRRPCVLLLAACATLGAYEWRIQFTGGASRVYRDYSSWIGIIHKWLDKEVSFTVDPNTDVVTAVGHTFSNGDGVTLVSSGTLPGGLTVKRGYLVCDISGDTFKLVVSGTGWTCATGIRADITDEGTGTHRMGIPLGNGPPPGSGWDVYLRPLTGVPSGVTYEVWCAHQLCPYYTKPVNGWRSYNGAFFFLLRFTASRAATLGQATITATIYNSVTKEDTQINLPLTVLDLTPTPSARPSSYPTVPGLATWQNSIPSMSLKWCDPTTYATAASSIGTLGAGVETQIWYYDGTWTFRQVARYLNDSLWNNCADYINDFYRGYVLANNGGILGYRAFSAGLKSSCASCDMRNRLAITMLASNQAYALTAGWPWDWYIRETAYYLETLAGYEAVTGTRHPRLQRAAENLLSMFDELFRDGTWSYQQTYWDGLAMRALIQYFELTGDQRVPVEIKNALDWLWANAWDDVNKRMVYNPAPFGPRCDYACWDRGGWDWTELIGLVVPAAGWYYWYSGDDTYRQRGDEWFKALPRWPVFTATASNDRIVIQEHGLSVDDSINVKKLRNQSLPGGMVDNGNYYVKSVIDANTFTISTSKGGATLNITSDGQGFAGLKCISSTCRGLDTGKMYNQLLRWAFAYVQWRQGQKPYAP